MKYIIKNCPAHFNNVQMLEFSEGDCNSDKVTKAYCKDKINFSSAYYCYNFLPKQIIMRSLKDNRLQGKLF